MPRCVVVVVLCLFLAVAVRAQLLDVTPKFPEIVRLNTSGWRENGGSKLPVVLWHGIGDCCCNPLSIGGLKMLLQVYLPGVYVRSLMIGKNVISDTINGYLMNVNDQVKEVCAKLSSDPHLRQGYNAIGFSQGGPLMRAVVQRCGRNPPVHNFISIGGPQQGVFGFPQCLAEHSSLCELVRRLLDLGAYNPLVQPHVAPAEYWHDPLQENTYRNMSLFLADINQERSFNPLYKKNLASVKNVVLVKFLRDTVVEPKDSEWFGFYRPGQDRDIVPLNETKLYTKDVLGLKQLNNDGRLHFLEVDGAHLQFSQTWFLTQIVDKFLRG